MDSRWTAAEGRGRTSCGTAGEGGAARLPPPPPPSPSPALPAPSPSVGCRGPRGRGGERAGRRGGAGWAPWLRCERVRCGLRRGAEWSGAEQSGPAQRSPARAYASRRVAVAPSPAGAGPPTELRPSGALARALGKPAAAGCRRKRRRRVPSRARHVGRAPQGPAVHWAPVPARHAAPAGRLQQRGGRGRRQHAQPRPADGPQLRRQGGARGAGDWEARFAPERDEGSGSGPAGHRAAPTLAPLSGGQACPRPRALGKKRLLPTAPAGSQPLAERPEGTGLPGWSRGQ